jgi:hypothetical protein
MKKLITIMLGLAIIGCADPAFQKYVAQRQAAIAHMPNGAAKAYEQSRLDEAVLVNALMEQQRASNAAAIFAQGMQNAGATYSAAAYTPYIMPQPQSTLGTSLNPVNVNIQQPYRFDSAAYNRAIFGH